ncbi:hypothetical protein AYI70_g10371 [Smittium culicis]|uniref:Uncharacterized protein n=1 Tax=Smittium culicis TaxID=133412 RepID=A0A1R1X6U9_9FUNG|nr:hypothetical protein AYI70_g10371 [Smittium culicis]
MGHERMLINAYSKSAHSSVAICCASVRVHFLIKFLSTSTLTASTGFSFLKPWSFSPAFADEGPVVPAASFIFLI